MPAMITFDHVTKRFGEQEAVRDLSLTINKGELFVLVGTSGSGKTTTLKMINRLQDPDEGTITFDGQPIDSRPVRQLRWDIGYVLQQIALFPTMTVGQNIALIPEMKHVPRGKVRQTVNDLLKSVDLDPSKYRDRMPSELSGGEQQRVGILRALATKPPVVLMDEPFSALDPLSRRQLQDLVLRLHDQLKMTIVFVTHDMNEAVRLGQRIAVMRKGKLLQVATPQGIADDPQNDFVDSFFATARRSALETPVRSLKDFGQQVHHGQTTIPADTPLRDVLPLIANSKNVTVALETGTFRLDAQAVVAFLAQQENV